MATHWTPSQSDLFDPAPPASQLSESDRRKALDLLQTLLTEAMTQPQEQTSEKPAEVCDDEDIV
jgi:hypothetical protein